MNPLIPFAAQLFFIACMAWLAAVLISAARHVNHPWPYSVRGLLLFVTVAMLTVAMAVAVIRNSS
jgi:hypothetical protein